MFHQVVTCLLCYEVLIRLAAIKKLLNAWRKRHLALNRVTSGSTYVTYPSNFNHYSIVYTIVYSNTV